jgi:putative transposase
MIKSHFGVAELVGLGGLPATKRAIQIHAETNGWNKHSRKRAGRGGGREYPLSCLPPETQAILLKRISDTYAQSLDPSISAEAAPRASVALPVSSLLSGKVSTAKAHPLPVAVASVAATSVSPAASTQIDVRDPRKPSKSQSLTTAQRDNGAARLALLGAVYALAATVGLWAAFDQVSAAITLGQLAPELMRLVAIANARAGVRGLTISATSLRRWHEKVKAISPDDLEGRLLAVCEVIPTPSLDIDPELLRVVAKWRQPNGGNLSHAIRETYPALGEVEQNRLYHRVNRAMAKIPQSVLDKGRHTGAGLAAKRPYVNRDKSALTVNDVWVIDGHSLKGKWAHPETGKPFIPEFTACLDVADRYCVGWSIALSETALGVAEALCNGIAAHGKPHTLYSDMGSGEKALHNTHEVYGTYQQHGIDHRTGIAGNPQARGVIERAWPSLIGSVERENPFYRGPDMDADTLRVRGKQMDKDLRAAARKGVDYDESGNVLPLVRNLPSFKKLIDDITESVAAYNNHCHRALPKHATEPRHLTLAEHRANLIAAMPEAVVMPDMSGLRLMLLPYRVVSVKRGLIRVTGQSYFSRTLFDVAEGQDVKAHFNVTDGGRVWVTTLEGRYLGEALFEANKKHFFPVSQIEAGRFRRAEGQQKLLQQKADLIAEEQAGVLAHIASADDVRRVEAVMARIDADQVAAAAAAPMPDNVTTMFERPMFYTARARYTWLYKHRASWNESDPEWMERFVSSPEYQEFAALYEQEGLGWP